MRKLIFSMGSSLDGYVAGPDGEIDWAAPSEELHAYYNEQTRQLGAQLCGRRLYEEMLPWELTDREPALEAEFAQIWRALPKIVFSRTLTRVEGNARLAEGSVEEEVARLKREPGGDIAVGGAGLAAACTKLGLIDEYQLFISPVVLGGGTPYFPPDARLALELVETRRFEPDVVYLRYRRH
jgi:dihydrofolate reductase